jgi:uncharacterized protein YkwD
VLGSRSAALRIALVWCLLASGAAGAGPAAAAPHERAMIDKINAARARHGAPPLRPSPSLRRSALAFARHLMRRDLFGHAARIRASPRFHALGEVLAIHRGGRPRRSFTVRAWMGSPGHRSVLLSRMFRRVGAARVRGRFHGRRTTIWVVQVGRY